MKSLPLTTTEIRNLLRTSLGKLPKRTWEWNKKTPQLPPLQKGNGKGHAYELLCLVDLAKRLRSQKLDLRFAGGDILHFNQSPGDLDVRLSYLVVYRGKLPLGVIALDILFHQPPGTASPDPLRLDQHEIDVIFCRVTEAPDKNGKVKVLTSDIVVSVFCKNKPWCKADYREFTGLIGEQSKWWGSEKDPTIRLRELLKNIFGKPPHPDPFGSLISPISAFASPTIAQSQPRRINALTTAYLLKIRN